MSEKDFAVGIVAMPQVGQIMSKPRYLVSLLDMSSKTKSITNFIALDKPDLQQGFIAVKGIYSDKNEDDIVKQFVDILSHTSKESILDLMFPNHRVHCIRSLIFNANKPSTLMK